MFPWLRGSLYVDRAVRVLKVVHHLFGSPARLCVMAENLGNGCTQPCGVVHEVVLRMSHLVALLPVQHNIQKELIQADSDEI